MWAGTLRLLNGATVWRVAALNATTGQLITSFLPKVASSVRAIVATENAVYMGGLFQGVGQASRQNLAAASPTDGSLLPWNPVAAGGKVNALALSPDKTQIVIGGAFTTLNGSSNPGYGLGSVDTTTGALLPWGANNLIRNGGSQAAIVSLASDDSNVYGSGYVFGAGGNLEGVFSANWRDGSIKWVDDCHGDTYGVYAADSAVYAAGHSHYCGNIGGFPQTDPWGFHRGLAFSKDATGTVTDDPYGYYNFAGNPSPSLLNWFPDLDTGTATGQNQGPWAVTGNFQYVVMGGEFRNVNSSAQQGLVRFAVKGIAPNKEGPRVTGSRLNPSLVSTAAGTARIAWQADWDRDNKQLTYQVIRDGKTASPIYTTTQESTFWNRPSMGYIDSGLVPGSTHTYRIFASDPFGNIAKSDSVTITVAASGTVSDYANKVLSDGALDFWRLGQASGSVVDWAGWNDLTPGTGMTRGASGAILGDSDKASTFDGTSAGFAATQSAIPGPDTFTVESWINTTSTSGGKIVGFGSNSTGNSGNYDRHVYMDNEGHIWFGVYTGGVQTLNSSGTYNDGQWHQIVASLGSTGMALYVDGKRVGHRSDVTSGQPYSGYWRVGGDNLGGWPNGPASSYLQGSIDDVSLYPAVLTLQQVQSHFTTSGRTLDIPSAPADAYGKSVFDAAPDIYWRLGESNGSAAADSGVNGNSGTYVSGVTLGAAGAVAGTANTAARFDGTSGLLSSNARFSNPTTYSEELWFNTTTTNGGKLIGFGSEATGLSGGYDRHVYMENDGRLTFGVWTGNPNTITSPNSYNDGSWHHMVATQASDGMKLYVDGGLVGTNPQNQAQNYDGYWRVGSDNTWGPQPYFAGLIDEVAVYATALSPEVVANHHSVGGGQTTPNQPPAAAFTSSSADLVASFDGSGSSDPDGTVAAYSWDFGDGSTAGTGAKPAHTYAAAGTYQVKLTVTDDAGATASVTNPVTAAAAGNQVLAQDAFGRSVASGWGSADQGGSWALNGSVSYFSVAGGVGSVALAKPGSGPSAYLNGISSTTAETGVKLSLNKVANGGGAYISVVGRRVGTTGEYAAKVKISATGGVTLEASKVVNGASSTLASRAISGLTYTAADQLQVRLQVTGTSPTQIRAKVWKVGATEPTAWQISTTDADSVLQTAGSVGLITYVSGTALNTPLTVRVDDYVVTRLG